MFRTSLVRGLVLALLNFTAVSAIYGGWMLLSDPTGSKLGLPIAFLRDTPFADYWWPGLTLLVAIGLGSTIVSVWMIRRQPYYSEGVIIEGLLLTGWIAIQYLLIREFHWLQAAFGGIGLVLIAAGAWLRRERDPLV